MSLKRDPRLSNAASSSAASFDGKRPATRAKESQFLLKHGYRHHAYDKEKAPYPVSFDKHVLELESIDHALLKHVHNSMSFVDFSQWEDGTPCRCLDLGCGGGTWAVEAAKEWPECEFIGFDLVNVQIPLKFVQPRISERIKWMHGNFLTSKLPFDDDEFDYIHIGGIARGVPENKVAPFTSSIPENLLTSRTSGEIYLKLKIFISAGCCTPLLTSLTLQEVNRVLRPGGAVEVVEEDIRFPLLPRWFTSPLRTRNVRTMSIHYPDGTQRLPKSASPQSGESDSNIHDHALLESLYDSVFENRFINTSPTAVLPSYFQTYFRQITMSPVITFPMPPFPPLPPLPQQATMTDFTASLLDPRSSVAPTSSALASSSSSALKRTTSLPLPSSSVAFSSLPSETIADDLDEHRVFGPSSRSRSSSNTTYNGDDQSVDNIFVQDKLVLDSSTEASSSPLMLYIEQLSSLSERSLAMHLYHAYQSVLACQEAMWDELKDRILNRKDTLTPYGWEDDEELEPLHSRKKFERLLDRYRSDMESRVSLWVSLTDMGWALPPRDPLSKAELIEEELIRERILEARKCVRPQVGDVEPPSRVIRILVGHKQELCI